MCLQQAVRFNQGKTMISGTQTSCIVALSDTSRFNSRRSIFLSPYFFACFSRKIKIRSRAQTEGRPNCCPPPPFRPTRDLFVIQTCWRRLCGCASPSDGSSLPTVLTFSLFSFFPLTFRIATMVRISQSGRDWIEIIAAREVLPLRNSAESKNACVEHSCNYSYFLFVFVLFRTFKIIFSKIRFISVK